MKHFFKNILSWILIQILIIIGLIIDLCFEIKSLFKKDNYE
jgi:hypothetical protein